MNPHEKAATGSDAEKSDESLSEGTFSLPKSVLIDVHNYATSVDIFI